jgi:hypothetical protein
MKEQTFVLRRGAKDFSRLLSFVASLVSGQDVAVTVKEHRRTRSTDQNAYLWGVVYPTILNSSVEMDGWTNDDLHELFLGEHYGWQTLSGFGRKRMKPMNRSSRLTTLQFMDHIEFIQRYMAERGVYIPDPNEEVRRVA